jgi:hypothetical protein
MKITFPTLLFLVFLALKLTGSIAWSWWWVTAPLWGPFTAVWAVALIAILGYVAQAIMASIARASKARGGK